MKLDGNSRGNWFNVEGEDSLFSVERKNGGMIRGLGCGRGGGRRRLGVTQMFEVAVVEVGLKLEVL